jgi:hypothetical protein
VQIVPFTTNGLSSNPVHGEVYAIQHYVIKFVSDRSVVFSTNKTDDISQILLKVTLNTITLPHHNFPICDEFLGEMYSINFMRYLSGTLDRMVVSSWERQSSPPIKVIVTMLLNRFC